MTNELEIKEMSKKNVEKNYNELLKDYKSLIKKIKSY